MTLRPRSVPGRATRSGRTGFGPLLLVFPLAFGVGYALRSVRAPQPDGFGGEALSERDAAQVPDVRAGAAVAGLEGRTRFERGELVARSAPLEAVPEAQAFIADRWGMRLGLPNGEPWRLDLVAEDGTPPLPIEELWIEDTTGIALTRPVVARDAKDPRATLFRMPDAPLEGGHRREVVLWGRPPQPGARLIVSLAGSDAPLELQLDAMRFAPGDLPRWLAAPDSSGSHVARRDRDQEAGSDPDRSVDEGDSNAEDRDASDAESDGPSDDSAALDGGPSDERTLHARIAELEAEVERLRARRAERELAWYQYNRALAALDVEALVGAFAVDEEVLRDEGLIGEPDESGGDGASEDPRSERDRELETGVRSLLAVEGFSGLDLLELGPVQPTGGAGPAVFRMLDDRGRLLGSLNAEVLRLEASRAARTITMVLEDGFESRGGNRTPFANGARRLLIPYVDPQPWIDALPELFPPTQLVADVDDGRWNLEEVRREMNGLLALETSSGWWRLHGLGGVIGNELRDVQLEQLADNGATRRRVFADSLRILLEDPGLLLVLQDGAILRGDKKTPFVDGSYRLFLPRAPRAEWRDANLPGIRAAEPEASGAPASDGGFDSEVE